MLGPSGKIDCMNGGTKNSARLEEALVSGVLTVTTASSNLVKSISYGGLTPRPSASEGAGIQSVRRTRPPADRVLMRHDP